MSIAIHLSVYLRYLDSINRPLLQYIIELFNVKVIFKHSISIQMAVRCLLLFTCLLSQIYRQHK